MPSLDIHLLPVLRDNYVYLVRDPAEGACAAVDPSVAEPVLRALDDLGWRLTHVLNTHHHGDHTGGNLARIPGLDVAVGDGDRYRLGAAEGQAFDIPGHTRGHIAFWFPDSRALFCGDTLFAMGCGRLFEGTPRQMWESLNKLRALPGDTRIYCGHEYTQTNARFALTIEPGNRALQARAREVDAMRAEGNPTIPATMAEELRTNPFLRADDPELGRAVGLDGADAVAVFAEIRRRKDAF
jgi:hydroxyacylglutathione hydrolase